MAMLDVDMTVLDPPELATEAETVVKRLAYAAGP
jgi:hypothetical protein